MDAEQRLPNLGDEACDNLLTPSSQAAAGAVHPGAGHHDPAASPVEAHEPHDLPPRPLSHKLFQSSVCSSNRLISLLSLVVLVQIVGILLLFMDKYKLLHPARSYSSSPSPEGLLDSGPQYFIKPRCFSMCESQDLFYRDDKLIKTVIAFSNRQYQPVRYYMFLFPDPPVYSEQQVDQPLLLSQYISTKRIEEARELSKVRDLQGMEDIESYSGFITVNSTYNSNIFFWYFPAASGNESAPLIIWLQGGPGSTGLYGLLKEHGPVKADVDPTGLPFIKKNPYSWSKNHSVIYVDNPVGTGFSFTDDDDGYPNYVENSTQDLYNFLQQFFQMFPEQQQNDFYAFGESYGGKYAPQLAYKIHQENQKLDDGNTKINLVGIGIGNGWMNPDEQGRYADYLLHHGLFDQDQHQHLDRIDEDITNLIKSELWDEAWTISDLQLDFILTSLNYTNLYDLTQAQYRPSTMNFWFWVEQMNVRKAMHVGNRTFSDGLDIYMSMVRDTMRPIRPVLKVILENYKVLAYHGAMDIICHYPGAEKMFRKMDWSGLADFLNSTRNAWWAFNEATHVHDLAGYYKKGGNLSLFLIRNAGHSVPLSQPQWSLRLLEDFIGGKI